MKLYQKLAVAATGFCLSAAMQAKSVQASTFNYDFTVDITSGPLDGDRGNGSFSYDDSALTGVGIESATLASLSFNFLGANYTEKSDLSYPDFPVVSFQDGSLLGLNYIVEDPASTRFTFGDALDSETGGDKFFYGSTHLPQPEGEGKVRYAPATASTLTPPGSTPSQSYYPSAASVPEPSVIAGLGLLGFGLLRKKTESARKG